MKFQLQLFSIFIFTGILFTSSIVVAEEFTATLDWSKRVSLSTQVNGLVQKVYAEPGKVVAKGEVLVQLDPRAYKADLKYAKANVKNTDVQTQEAKRELDRQADMYDRSMLSDRDLQVAKNNLTAAQAMYYQAKSSLTRAKLNLEYSAIRAPFNAVVIRTMAVKGQVVVSQIEPPILVIVAEANRMIAHFYTTANKINNFVVNQGVIVKVAGETYQGKILNIALEPEKTNLANYAVNVIFDSKNKVLRAGQKALLDL